MSSIHALKKPQAIHPDLPPSGSGRAALILAAGASSRMGTPKALLPWLGRSLLEYAVEQALTAGAQSVVVVLGTDADAVLPAVPVYPAVQVVVNPFPEAGRSGSIRLRARALGDSAGPILVQSVDQPCPSAIVASLFQAAEDTSARVVVPTYRGRRGHPMCLAPVLLAEARAVDEETLGLRAIMLRHRQHTLEVPVQDAVILLNLNDPTAYATAICEQAE